MFFVGENQAPRKGSSGVNMMHIMSPTDFTSANEGASGRDSNLAMDRNSSNESRTLHASLQAQDGEKHYRGIISRIGSVLHRDHHSSKSKHVVGAGNGLPKATLDQRQAGRMEEFKQHTMMLKIELSQLMKLAHPAIHNHADLKKRYNRLLEADSIRAERMSLLEKKLASASKVAEEAAKAQEERIEERLQVAENELQKEQANLKVLTTKLKEIARNSAKHIADAESWEEKIKSLASQLDEREGKRGARATDVVSDIFRRSPNYLIVIQVLTLIVLLLRMLVTTFGRQNRPAFYLV
jgi:hypothetical protein